MIISIKVRQTQLQYYILWGWRHVSATCLRLIYKMYILCCVSDWDSFPFQCDILYIPLSLLKLHVYHTNCCFWVQNYLCTVDVELKLISQIQNINKNYNNFFKSKWVRAKVRHKQCKIHRIWVKLTPIRNPTCVQFKEFWCFSVPSIVIQVNRI
jgi:hypothetical protein